jgi:hypothetical protein
MVGWRYVQIVGTEIPLPYVVADNNVVDRIAGGRPHARARQAERVEDLLLQSRGEVCVTASMTKPKWEKAAFE